MPVGAAALIVTGALVTPRMALADLQLPARSADELLADLQQAEPSPLSGTIEVSADLGLPQLPGAGSSDSAASLLSGDHTLRVWLDGPTRQRLALLGRASEKVLVRDGADVWSWSSAEATADHLVLPESQSATSDQELGDLSGMPLPVTPQEAAELVLATLDPTTEVSVAGTAVVADRDVYQLVLAPRDEITLVERVVLSVDAQTSTPLRLQVFSTRMAEPALSVGFSSVDFSTPDPEVFAFTAPPGATVTEHSAQELARAHGPGSGGGAGGGPWVAFGERSPVGELPEPTSVGSGWSRIVVASLPADGLADLAEQGSGQGATSGGDGASEPDPGPAASALAMLQLLPTTSGPWGSGRVLAGTLFTVIVTDDGRIAAGAVPPDAVGDALASTS